MKVLKKTGYILVLLIFLILVLVPFIWAFILSITSEYAMLARDTALLPRTITFENYAEIFESGTSGQCILAQRGVYKLVSSNDHMAYVQLFCYNTEGTGRGSSY